MATEHTVRDPVCGMTVDPATAKHKTSHGGQDYYFCSAGCRTKFESDPGRYLNKAEAPPPKAAAGTIYTCPMHPEIRQDHPGACPICGMALEPLTITAEEKPNVELADMARRFGWRCCWRCRWWCWAWARDAGPGPVCSAAVSQWIQFALATPVVWWAGWPFFSAGWASVLSRNLNMFTLIALGTGAAWTTSVAATSPDLFPDGFHVRRNGHRFILNRRR